MAVHLTTASWRRELQTYKSRLKADIATVIRTVVTRLATKIIMRTPVHTGRASGSWAVSFGSPEPADLGPGSWQGWNEYAIGRIKARLGEHVRASNPFVKVYLNNTVPYIDVLEKGHSTQAPRGMVRISVAEVRASLRG